MSASLGRLARSMICSSIFALNVSSASAQADGVRRVETTVAELRIEACDDALHREIRAAMDLEVDAGIALTETMPETSSGVRFHVVAPCTDPSYVELQDDAIGLVVRRAIELGEFPVHLRPRMIALVAHELARLDRNARATRLENAEPTVLLAPPSEVESEETAPVIGVADTSAQVPEPVGGPVYDRVPSRPVALEVDAVSRVFFRNPVFLEGGRFGLSTGRIATGLLALGTRKPVQAGSVGILGLTVDLGLRLWPRRASRSPFSFGLRGEAGLVRTQGRPDPVRGYSIEGNRAFTPTAGGSATAAMVFAARDVDAAFRIDVEFGAMVGPRLNPTAGPWKDQTIVVSGVQTSLRIGAQF